MLARSRKFRAIRQRRHRAAYGVCHCRFADFLAEKVAQSGALRQICVAFIRKSLSESRYLFDVNTFLVILPCVDPSTAIASSEAESSPPASAALASRPPKPAGAPEITTSYVTPGDSALRGSAIVRLPQCLQCRRRSRLNRTQSPIHAEMIRPGRCRPSPPTHPYAKADQRPSGSLGTVSFQLRASARPRFPAPPEAAFLFPDRTC